MFLNTKQIIELMMLFMVLFIIRSMDFITEYELIILYSALIVNIIMHMIPILLSHDHKNIKHKDLHKLSYYEQKMHLLSHHRHIPIVSSIILILILICSWKLSYYIRIILLNLKII